MKNILVGLFLTTLGSIMVSASFIDIGLLPKAGPGAPGQTASSILGAVMACGGVAKIASHFRDTKPE